jgi:hypothetical protein
MAFTRGYYDTCYYTNEILQSVGTFNYTVDVNKFQHHAPARMAFGIVAGNDVSICKNMVDVESDLMGIDRKLSKCPTLKYINQCTGTEDMTKCQPRQVVMRGNPSNRGRVLDTQPLHLREAQMFRYTPIPVPASVFVPRC